MSVSVGDSNILPSPKVRDLGVIFDECLTLDAHISNICRRAHFHLRNIGRIRMLLSFEASSQLIHALITTTLDYCNNSSNRTRRLLSIPPISKMCANSYFERSFSYAAPFLWNRLDISVRMLDFDYFKSRIKTELYLNSKVF